MKILLLTPNYSTEKRYGKNLKNVGVMLLPPLGLAYLAGCLEKKGHEIRIVDMPIKGWTDERFKAYLKREQFDMAGVTTMTPSYSDFVRLVRLIRETDKKVAIVAGGPHPTVLPFETMEEVIDIDYVVVGEGEETITELADAIEGKRSKDSVAGIVYRDRNKKLVFTGARKLIENLDELPFPAWHLLDLEKYVPAPSSYRQLPATHMITSRGCPFACHYCSAQSTFGRRYRQHSVERIMQEILFLKKNYGIKEIFFWDDIFILDRDRTLKFCDELIRRRIGISWSCNSRVNLVDLPLLRKMKKAGCWLIHFGVESGSQRLLNLINKNIKLAESERAMRLTRKAGIQSRAYFMLGFPTETREESMRTINFAEKIDPDYIKVSLVTPYPGTVLFDMVKDKVSRNWNEYTTMGGYIGNKRPFVPERRTSDELNNLQKLAHKRFFLNPKRICRHVLNIRSFDEFNVHFRSFLALVKS